MCCAATHLVAVVKGDACALQVHPRSSHGVKAIQQPLRALNSAFVHADLDKALSANQLQSCSTYFNMAHMPKVWSDSLSVRDVSQ